MQLVRVRQLQEGMILARDVLDYSGRILLLEGVELKTAFIDRLEKLGVYAVYVLHKDSSASHQSIISLNKKETVKAVEKALSGLAQDKNIKTALLRETINKLIQDIINSQVVALCVPDLEDYDSYTKEHSVNVAILSIITGINLGLTNSELVELGIGTLLHDIGKVLVKKEILNKKEKLTQLEWEEIKRHPEYGNKMLSYNTDISQEALAVVKEHHERINSTGYPEGLNGKNISLFAKIAMVADSFDAMTSPRVYKKNVTPYEASEVLRAMAGYLYDEDVTKAFLDSLLSYPIGSTVRLSNGEIGYVESIHGDNQENARIKLLYDASGVMYRENKFISLVENDIEIVGIA